LQTFQRDALEDTEVIYALLPPTFCFSAAQYRSLSYFIRGSSPWPDLVPVRATSN
ncbi:uncharacterized, partial [Tachysurus ichikawai]